MLGEGAGRISRDSESVPVQPLAAVTVTVYVPAEFTVIDGVLCPVVQSYVIKLAVVLNVVFEPSQILKLPVTIGCGGASSIIKILFVAVQPNPSVTVTV